MFSKKLCVLVILAFAFGACGEGEPQEEERTDPAMLGGKTDIPWWLVHIPADWGCDQTLNDVFFGWDSAHLYSFPGKWGYEFTFTFVGNYPWYKGAVIAVYDSETGKRVAYQRNRWSNQAEVTYEAEKSIKYLVAVYSVSVYATGSYTLHAKCDKLFTTCQSNTTCAASEFCKFDSGCGTTGLGVCTKMPYMCNAKYAPVCGCDGQTYSNSCNAEAAGVSVDHTGACATQTQCELAGGYCEYFLTACKDGYVDGAAMDCPMGKSGKCCMPGGLTVTTDKAGYQVGETVEATIDNQTSASAFFGGCSVFSWEKQVNGNWVNQGPDVVCFWEGNAVEVKAGATLVEQLNASKQGTFRLAAAYGIGCTPGQPLSQANCTATSTAHSPAFVVKMCKIGMPNPNAFCPDGKMVPVLDADGICTEKYDCLPCEVADCGPALGMPNTLCPDGQTVSGPTGNCIASGWGTCSWEVISCPE